MKDYYSTGEAGVILGLTPAGVRYNIMAGKIKAERNFKGGRRMISKAEMQRVLKERGKSK